MSAMKKSSQRVAALTLSVTVGLILFALGLTGCSRIARSMRRCERGVG